jgi:hypothetical protein
VVRFHLDESHTLADVCALDLMNFEIKEEQFVKSVVMAFRSKMNINFGRYQ